MHVGQAEPSLTEANGVPVGLTVEGANRHDKKVAEATLESIPVDRPEPTEDEPQGMCLDKGYDYDNTRELVRMSSANYCIRARGEEAKELGERRARRRVAGWWSGHNIWMNRMETDLIRWEKMVRELFHHVDRRLSQQYVSIRRPAGIDSKTGLVGKTPAAPDAWRPLRSRCVA